MPTLEETPVAVTRSLQLRFEAIEHALPESRPLVHLVSVMDLLGCDEDRAKYLYECGLLRFAFNLGDAKTKRMEVRVWRCSLMDYARCSAIGDYASIQSSGTTLAEVIRECLPPGECLTVAKLHRLWGISSTHLHDLLSAGALAAVPGQTLKAKQSPLLQRGSVSAFLKARRIGSHD